MTRLLLTFLALLTGLVAHSAPAAARVCDVSGAQVGALDAPLAAVRSAAQGQQVGGPRARCEVVAVERGCRKPPRQTVFLPTVQLGPDRARE
jgi:hypothetical protein